MSLQDKMKTVKTIVAQIYSGALKIILYDLWPLLFLKFLRHVTKCTIIIIIIIIMCQVPHVPVTEKNISLFVPVVNIKVLFHHNSCSHNNYTILLDFVENKNHFSASSKCKLLHIYYHQVIFTLFSILYIIECLKKLLLRAWEIFPENISPKTISLQCLQGELQ